MYGLAVNLIMSVSGHPSIINEMKTVIINTNFALIVQIFHSIGTNFYHTWVVIAD